MLKWILLLLLAIVAIVAGAGFLRNSGRGEAPAWQWQGKGPLEVTSERADRRRIVRTVEATGEVDAEVEVDITAQVVAKILHLPVKEGQRVKKGDLIVQLDAAAKQAELNAAEARIQQLRAAIDLTHSEIEKASRDLERSAKLVDTRAVTAEKLADLQTLFDQAKTRLRLKEAELAEAESRVTKAREELHDTTIYSPIDGLVSRVVLQEGEVVVMGTIGVPGSVIMVISDTSTMFLRAWIDEADAPLLAAGQEAAIHLPYQRNDRLRGKVRQLAPKALNTLAKNAATTAAAPNSQDKVARFEAWIDLTERPEQLRLGMNANVSIEVDAHDDVVTVPVQAVLQRRGKELPPDFLAQAAPIVAGPGAPSDPLRRFYHVAAVRHAGRCQWRSVQPGISDDQRVEILSGLDAGDDVVTGPYRVFDQLRHDAPLVELDESKATEKFFGFGF